MPPLTFLLRPLLGAVLAAAICFGAPTAGQAEVTYRESVRTYELGGRIRTRRDVWNAIRFDGAVGTALTNAIGTATWHVRPRWWWKQTPAGRCTINRVKVAVDVLIRVPEWHFAHRTAPHVRKYFACVRETVMVHEKRHGEIAKGMGDAIERALLREVRDVACVRASEIATEIYRREMRAGKSRQKAFDAADRRRNRYQRCNRISQPPKKTVRTAPQLKPKPVRETVEAPEVERIETATTDEERTPVRMRAADDPDMPWTRLALGLLFALGAAWWVRETMAGR
jgi:predicted secreted Zn-dependent protease